MQSFEIDSYIQGEKFKQARESQSLSRKSLAQKACCSALQIEEIEEGGKSAFYMESQKLNTAKKLANILGLDEEQAFLGTAPELKSALNLDDFQKVKKISRSSQFSFSGPFGLVLILTLLGSYGVYEYIAPDQNLYAITTNSSNASVKTDLDTPKEKNDQDMVNEPVVVSQTNDPCSIQTQNSTTFVPTAANFAGNFIVFTSKTLQTICVVDGLGKSQKVEITPGLNKVVNGVGPFKILGYQLQAVDTYYQGWKVVNVALNTQSIELKELPMQIRTEPAKTIVVSKSADVKDLETSSGTTPTAARLNTNMDNTNPAAINDAKFTYSPVSSNED